MPAGDLQWLDINDFTPGIHARVGRTGFGAGAGAQPGIASPTNTYRCVALDDGPLAPLWYRDFSLNYDTLPDGALGGGRQYNITNFTIIPSITSFTSDRYHEAWFGVEWVDGTNRKFNLRRYRSFDATWDAVLATISNTDTPTVDQYVNTNVIATRANRTTPTDPALPVVIISRVDPGATSKKIWQFPDEAAASTTAVDDLGFTLATSRLVGHQGRIIILERTNYDHGAVGDWVANENIYFTVPNDTDTLESATATQFSPENASGYAVLASMTANDLLAVKRSGGGVAITGDIADPTVTNLPMLPSARPCIAAVTPIGIVYLATSGGVMAWSGGDSAEPIGRQLEDFCWVATNTLLEYGAVLALVGTDQIVLPRGWVYNIATQSWWRLENEADLRQQLWNFQDGFSESGHYLYGACSTFNATNVPIIYGWDTDIPAKSFSWQSHPMWLNRGRNVKTRQLIIEAEGTGTVAVTITGSDGGTATVTFTFASDSVVNRQRGDINVSSESVVVRIVSTGGSGGTLPAPTVHGLHIGWHDNVGVARSGVNS